jgi:Tfp pilus assembly protein PilV
VKREPGKGMKAAGLYSQRGSSLIEVMTAMAAGLVVLLAALQAMLYFQREFARHQAQIAQQQDVRLGLELFEQEIRLAGWESLSIARPDAVEFTANVSGFMTNVNAPVLAGQTALTVDDGRGWPENKTVRVCWEDQCENFTLARGGARNVLTLVEPAPRPIPPGASVMVMNRLRYYSRPGEDGIVKWLRQIDGGASVMAGDLARVRLSYWDAQGRPTMQPNSVRRIVVEIAFAGRAIKEMREIALRM